MKVPVRGSLLLILVLPVLADWPHTTVADKKSDRLSQAAGKDDLVAVIWDATDEAGCTLEVAEGTGPFVAIPCPPGTVIYALTTTRENAQAYSGRTVDLSGVPKQDEVLIGQTADQAHEAVAIDVSRSARACGSGKSINGSYNVDGKRARYSMRYEVKRCSNVRNVQDRAWTSDADSGDVQWVKSCTNGNSSCRDRNIILTTNATPWKNEDTSRVGNRYRHHSINIPACQQGICINAYGYWDFD